MPRVEVGVGVGDVRRCSKCKEQKELSCFYMRTVRGRRVPRAWCKTCELSRDRHRYETKRCSECGEEREIRADAVVCGSQCARIANQRKAVQRSIDRRLKRYAGKSTPIPWRECRVCGSAFIARGARRNRVICSKECAGDENRGRFSYSKTLMRSLRPLDVVIQGRSCTYCGVTGVKMEGDHVVPLSKGGLAAHNPENVVPACKSCNSDKQGYLLPEWLERLEEKADRLRTALEITERRIAGVRALQADPQAGVAPPSRSAS